MNITQRDINEAINTLVRKSVADGATIADILGGIEDAKADAPYISEQHRIGKAA